MSAKRGREMQQAGFGAGEVGEGGRSSLIVEFGGKATESAAGLEVLGRAPEVGVSASTLRSSWVGMAALPLLWPLGWGPALACFHHPFLLFTPPHPPLYFRNGFITAQKEMFQNWFVKVNTSACDHISSGRRRSLCFWATVQHII